MTVLRTVFYCTLPLEKRHPTEVDVISADLNASDWVDFDLSAGNLVISRQATHLRAGRDGSI